MVKADLHVHCKASRRPAEWFLQKVGARESYTQVETLYQAAKSNGMNFVTISDHNTLEGALELVKNHPEDSFMSVEVTTYFPEDNCKIHILVFDLTEEQFEIINNIRPNIYKLREYIKQENLAYSVAHGFYSVNGRLCIENLEKLIVMFDVFESVNGARNRFHNQTWTEILENLNSETFQDLAEKYGIEPMTKNSWNKGFTGGSDDHAGLFIGCTATVCYEATSKEEFLMSVKNRKTIGAGRCNDYKSFALSIYKIFYDFSSACGQNNTTGIVSFINNTMFEDHKSPLKNWIALQKMKRGNLPKDEIFSVFVQDLLAWSHSPGLDMETKMENIYQSMGTLLDSFFKMLLVSLEKDLARGDISRVFKNIMSSLPAFFISLPFFSSLRHLSGDRDMLLELREKYLGTTVKGNKRVLWFSDTMTDLNGVSVILNKFRTQSIQRDLNLYFVSCSNENEKVAGQDTGQTFVDQDAQRMIFLPCMYSITPEFYKGYTMNFPSLLESMEIIYKMRPDRIIISTPGPVGLLGMVMAYCLGIEAVSIYHTDFSIQAKLIFGNDALADFIKLGINKFYSFSHHIKVPSLAYVDILQEQGMDVDKMSLFKRGYNANPVPRVALSLGSKEKKINKNKGFSLMWAGRVSKDKNVDFLIEVYEQVSRHLSDVSLLLCGDGPDLERIKKKCKKMDQVIFTGHIPHEELADYYSSSDLFVFPSIMDTFGMVIFEAQSHGVPALVTDKGGPCQIIDNERTGKIIPVEDFDGWVKAIKDIYALKKEFPQQFESMRNACKENIIKNYNWEDALNDILGEPVLTVQGNNFEKALSVRQVA